MDLAYLHEFCRKFDYPAAAETALTAGAQAIAADPEAGRVFDALVAEYERLGTDTDLNAALRELRRVLPRARRGGGAHAGCGSARRAQCSPPAARRAR